MFKSILAAVDGSAAGERAVAFAGALAGNFGAKLTLLHAQTELGRGIVPQEFEAYARIEHVALTEAEMMRGAAEELLQRAAARAREAGASEVQTVLEFGDPAGILVDYAKANAVDLVVMGRRGLGTLGGLLLGSVSHKVTQAVPCACMTVP